MSDHDDASDDLELRLHRELDAPRELVWRVLTDPAHLERWWGPTGFRSVTQVHDLRPGGHWRFTMHGPDGREYPNHARFEEIEPPSRLVMRYLDDPTGERLSTLTLEALGPTRTRFELSLRFPSAEARAAVLRRSAAVEGGNQTLARLAALVAVLQGAEEDEGLVVRRVVAAPRERVWAAWTEADRLHRWFHPTAWRITSSALDLRVGGTFHYAFEGEQLGTTWALWRFTEIDPPRRLVFELSFSDARGELAPSPFPGPWPARTTTAVTLEPHAGYGGGTLVTVRSTPLGASGAERDAFRSLHGSMETGWGETLDSLVDAVAAGS